MELIHNLINIRFEQHKDLELNNEHIKSIWHFYEIYQICLNVLGMSDPLINKKKYLMKVLREKPDDLPTLSKLKEYVSEDSSVIEVALKSLEKTEETEEVEEDFYPDSVFGVNVDDRGN